MADDAFVPPATRLETAVAGIWREILDLEQVGRDDDFFEVGGESLAAVRMLAALDELLLTQISFADFLDTPTVAGLAALVAQARQSPDTSVAEAGAPAPPVTASQSDSATAPCTFAQERLWFVDQFAGGTGAYNESVGARLRGPLDAGALERGLQEVVRRHSALRTSFTVRDGTPMQVVNAGATFALQRVDVAGHPEPEAELRRVTEELVSRPFDLARAPLVRGALVRVADDEHVLQLVFHHNVSDGLSHVVVLGELAELYRAETRGEPVALPAPGVQYADFARWQREQMDDAALERAIAPWRERLADIPAALDLPTDHPRPPVPSYVGATRRSRLDAATTAELQSFSRAEGVTPFATLLAAFDVLLHRYSGQQTIMVGTATAGRDRPELENVVGLMANTIVLRNELSGELTFRELLGRVRGVVLDAVAHQDAPFERLVAELQREPDLSRHPIFQVFLAFRPHAALELPGAEPFYATSQTARADLTLWVEDAPGGYELVWEYSTDLFEATTVERFERHFLRLLGAGLARPQTAIAELPMLDAAETAELLAESAAVREDYPVACMHTLFERQAALTPDAPAVVFEDRILTYAELNERANQLAHRLRELGIGSESLVALFLERSFELVVAILAVLKAGGAYVPIDPEYPSARVSFVLSDTSAPVLLSQERLLERLPAHDATVLCLDRDDLGLEHQDSSNPPLLTSPENLAYVIYTSGSTGQPKGVQVEHRQVARLFTATDAWYGFNPTDVWVLAHSYAFDVSVWELWGALAHGGRIVVSPFWVTRSPEAFAGLVAEHRVTVLCATPSLFGSVQDELIRRGDELAIRYVVFAGEALAPASLRPWFERFGETGAALVNMYGITETTVHSTYRVMRASDCDRDTSPVGVPIPDLSLYLLDSSGVPVPPGVAGEIYVGGAGVTRGYLGRAELTAQRFLPNPFGSGRLYRSGDLARRLPDGEIGFLGRMDDQVKIRGFRIELGEIRSVIEDHEAVAESAVLAVRAGADDVRLAAYVVPDAELAGPVRRIARMQHEQRLTPGQLFELPDGTAVAHVNPAETEYLFEEIFVRDDYFRRGVELPEDACVVDVGANIGLFALLVARRVPKARILAFEPMPAVYDVLKLNGEIHGLELRAFDCAVGARPGTASFTYFPHVTLLSGRYADSGADAAMVRQMLANAGELDGSADIDELLADRLESVTIERPIRTISEILGEEGVDRVDLLKIDAEKGELDVLDGIAADDWPKIRQVAVEVHGGQERLQAVTARLTQAGFEVSVDEDELLLGSGLYNVFARRAMPTVAPAAPRTGWRSLARLRDELRTQLEGRLPAYMVPASIAFADELPLTTNGKLDRRALPAPEWEQERTHDFVAPRTPTELMVAEIWSELLGAARVGTQDSFFELGGHSLLAARVIARVRDLAGVHVPVRVLFEHPTLAAFAAHVEAVSQHGREPAGEVIGDAPVRSGASEFPLSFQQQSLLFFDQFSPDSVAYNSALALRVRGELHRDVLADALTEVYRRHEVLRTVLLFDEDPRQVVLAPDAVSVPLEDLSDAPVPGGADELQRRLRELARRPFDLAAESPLRTTLLRVDEDEHVILFQPHHVSFDARAVEVLYGELAEIYRARLQRRDPVLPEIELQYGDFALWQRERLQGELLASELDFWRMKLAGAPTRLQLPSDHRRPAQLQFAGRTLVQQLGSELAAQVRATCRSAQVTPYMLLLGAFATLLYRRSGQDDILFGGPIANRERPEFENLIGFFSNTTVTRVQLHGNPTFAELLARVRGVVLEAQEHQEAPLSLVVDAVSPVRDSAYNPLFQVNFRVRVGPPSTLRLDGADVTPIDVDLGLARFDLALELHLSDDALEAEFNWNTALFEPETVERLAADFALVLGQGVADPGTRVLGFELRGAEPDAPVPERLRAGGIRGARRAL